jgi:hypothetical protein
MSTEGGSHPTWTPAGGELFYFATIGSAEAAGATTARLMSVSIKQGAEFRAGRPQPLFERRVVVFGHPYEPSPDASRFVAITPGDEGEPIGQVNLLLPWRPQAPH